ncbi:hypothetical protein GNI_095200 [Gregarina niphandrodes]|uniref:Uncharacterized protein n=1 Tax=Gregarina niphandrodes TaxID=110365 RepID=A0A023B520_GRENI|nr:hypothetical protein GNI_095200 [Gregarina niphandrodes]EZG58329.1 hypothetical protein GNI_095200 [Gregarina niphandrodes]|eukprot:XP_011130981.1 hypothetical protein GNI_095200 [Gregarina niphandrodes]
MPSLARWMSPKRQDLNEGDSPVISPAARGKYHHKYGSHNTLGSHAVSQTVIEDNTAQVDGKGVRNSVVFAECLESPLLRTKDSPLGDGGSHQPSTNTGDKCVTLQQVAKLMTHPTLLQKEWKAFYCSAKTGKGIDEAFQWLATTLSFSS